ncbi:arylesterase [Thaumasiovibrio subtropicus]|uniref:arylesterase n=1 Tax=Thaumasiovibrio subtropicus TaxID=1891207 RepID=UPI000B35C115|nr:arylesterase [Thaumasiovibrio subtropicus]
MKKFLLYLLLCLSSHSLWADAKLLIVGDSLSAGYRMQANESWPYLLDSKLDPQGITVINASISGDTTGNGAARLPELLSKHQPDFVFIGLGANDGLRGFNPAVTQKQLTQMIEDSLAIDADVFLMQVRVPPNYGKRYSDRFEKMYPKLSDKFDIPLVPFFLEHVIINNEWMMDDGLHPNADAQPFIAQFVYDEIHPHLSK